MLNRPKFKSSFEINMIEPDSLYISEGFTTLIRLKGAVYCDVVKVILTENLTQDEILDKLNHKYSFENLYYALMKLEQMELLYDQCSELPDALNKLLGQFGIQPTTAFKKIQETPIHILELSQSSNKETFTTLLNSYNLSLSSDVESAELVLVLLDDYLDPMFKKLADDLSQKNKKILPLKIGGHNPWIGPVLKNYQGCHDCLLARMKTNSSESLLIRATKGVQFLQTAEEVKDAAIHTGSLNWSALQVLKHIVCTESCDLDHKLVVFNMLTTDSVSHTLVPLPHCERCGTPRDETLPKEVTLKSQKKTYVQDGGHRVISPKETCERLEKFVSPILGIVQYVAKLKELQEPLHVYQATFPEKLPDWLPLALLKENRRGAAGKGKGDDQAKASCLCEAIERYCSSDYSSKEIIRGSYEQLKDQAIHPDLLQHYSQKQFEERHATNKLNLKFQAVADPFDEKAEMAWAKIWSLSEKKYKLIPEAYFCYNISYYANTASQIRADSNGCAAGNTFEEAVLQGLFELIERDQCALWWYSMIQVPELDLLSFKDPYIQSLVNAYKKLDRKIWVLDITFDLQVPTFAAISTHSEGCFLMGLGTHLDPDIALSRALSELNQGLTLDKAVLEVKGDELYLQPKPNSTKKKRSDFKNLCTDDIAEDIQVCQKILEDHGLELLVADLSHPEIDLKIARVVVPKLRHFWKRLAPGRLYDVPYKLGLVKKKLTEEELNPTPVTF